jgi:hypothetical protein
MSRRPLHSLAPLAIAVAVAVALPGAAEAQRRPAAADQARARPAASVAAAAARHRPAQVSPTLQRKVGGRPILMATRDSAAAYARDLRDTIEVLFAPRASEYGHLYVRVGERLYDLPGPWGARAQAFGDAMRWVNSPMYGFVFDSTPEEVAAVDGAFRALIASRPRFSVYGTGPGEFSCAGFCTAVLQDRVPALRIGLSAGAIDTAARLFRSGLHQGVTIYGSATARTGDDGFSFERLE